MSKDMFGREYLKLSEAKVGMKIELDDGFDCRTQGQAILHSLNDRLFFNCEHGIHYIYGQCYQDSDYCIGIYKVG